MSPEHKMEFNALQRHSIEEMMLAKEKALEQKSKSHWFGHKKVERTVFAREGTHTIESREHVKKIMSADTFRNAFDFMLHYFDDLNWMIPGDPKNDPNTVTEMRCKIIFEFQTKMVSYKKYYSINTESEVWEIIEKKFRGNYIALCKILKRRKDGSKIN